MANLEINPYPKQDAFLFAPEKYAAFVAGIGTGKTFAGSIWALMNTPGRIGMAIAPTFPMLRDVVVTEIRRILDAANHKYIYNEGKHEFLYKGGKIICRSAEKPDHLRGPNLDWFWLDEAAMMKYRVFQIMQGRIRRSRNGKGRITTTPAGYNYIYDLFYDNPKKQFGYYTAETKDNIYLPEDYIEDLYDSYTGSFLEQELRGKFVNFEGLIYPDFSKDIHVIAPFKIPKGWKKVRGIDFGYVNPFVCLWVAFDEDGRAYIYRQRYKRKTLLRDHAAAIKEYIEPIAYTVSDHDAQDQAELEEYGINTVNASKNVQQGLQRVQARLKLQGDGKPRIFVFEDCVDVVKEFSQYLWKEGKDEPIKENDHAMDVVRYIIMQEDAKAHGLGKQDKIKGGITAGLRNMEF